VDIVLAGRDGLENRTLNFEGDVLLIDEIQAIHVYRNKVTST
jgi:hypothetical protein